MNLFLVVPCYNEEEVLPDTAKKLLAKMEALCSSGAITQGSIVFVDDGSKDGTWAIIERLHGENERFRGIRLSRNRGHQNALLAGLLTVKSECDAAVSLDADLQDDIDAIDAMLESVTVVAVMLIVGGIFMLFCDRIFGNGSETTALTEKRAFVIGLFQCISMIPGVSRSMATIVGGMAQKLTRKAAAEFSFFLAVPTMFAATVYKMAKLFMDGGTTIIMNNLTPLIVGNIVAFIVAMLAIKFFISFVTKYGFVAFGWYRIIVGAAILIMTFLGYNLELA